MKLGRKVGNKSSIRSEDIFLDFINLLIRFRLFFRFLLLLHGFSCTCVIFHRKKLT